MPTSHSMLAEKPEVDAAEPFKGVIVCCTSIPPEHRTVLAQKVAELGGVHKYDLTPDVTHLVVGDYDTPKYRHVARERPDIKAMDASWINATHDLWKNDDNIEFGEIEREHQLRPLETCGMEPASQEDAGPTARGSLLICLTGFGDAREDIAERVRESGGRHTGDLTRKCTHLIVSKPEGKKFTAARTWGVHTVTLDWLLQSIERGMILEETKFDPLLPPEEQGQGAWVKEIPQRAGLGKRSRSSVLNGAAEEGTRKLRKTASMKLSFQRNNMWGDILGRSDSKEYSFAHDDQSNASADPAAAAVAGEVPTQPGYTLPQEDRGVFSNCTFVVHGFPKQRTNVLQQTISTMGGSVASSLADPAMAQPEDPQIRRFLIVPQTSQPDTHPQLPDDGIYIVTEFYIENCLHNKRFFSPNEQVLGRPFPLFPIPGFSSLIVCSAAFTGIELNQVARSVGQLGARFEEQFRKNSSVLVCKSLESMRKEKLKCALEWGVPVVSGDWLWECISTGYLVPIEDFIYHEIKKRYTDKKALRAAEKKAEPKPVSGASEKQASEKPNVRAPANAGVDTTAFDHDSPEKATRKKSTGLLNGDSVTSADFMTARSQQNDSFLKPADAAPLSELSPAALNKSPKLGSKAAFGAGSLRTISVPVKGLDSESRVGVPERVPSAPPIRRRDPFLQEEDEDKEEADDETAGSAASTRKEQEAEEAKEAKQIVEEDEQARDQARAAEVRQGLTSALSNLIQPSAAAGAQEEGKSRRRRQKILGRAVSNVSNASSAASIDSSKIIADSMQDEDEELMLPPATQLEYIDAGALESKAILMGKIQPDQAKSTPSSTAGGRRGLRKR